MISLENIEKSILELEQGDTTFSVCEKLSWLYTCRDHIRGYSTESEKPIEVSGNSELLIAANGKNPSAVWAIIDELMETIKVLHPNMYDSVIQRLSDI